MRKKHYVKCLRSSCFNPCFNGSSILIRLRKLRICLRKEVSILVLMEVRF
ncbi:hypothetical protein MCHI_001444 [Candidatus Magnetoovum chiemensis]|nr:hypothetical protein MCHI_001444 [Candidatus Magnetoovum chiemensis]